MREFTCGTASERNDNTNENPDRKKSKKRVWGGDPSRAVAPLVVLDHRLRERVNELQAEEAEISGGFLTENTSGNGGCLVGDQSGGRRRRGGDG